MGVKETRREKTRKSRRRKRRKRRTEKIRKREEKKMMTTITITAIVQSTSKTVNHTYRTTYFLCLLAITVL